MKYHPQYWVCFVVIGLIIFQICIIYLQNKKGPHFFIKKNWLPNYYEYYHKFKIDSKSTLYDEECPICLSTLAE
jgi:hypothetical protein